MASTKVIQLDWQVREALVWHLPQSRPSLPHSTLPRPRMPEGSNRLYWTESQVITLWIQFAGRP